MADVGFRALGFRVQGKGLPGPQKHVKHWPLWLSLWVWGYYFTYFWGLRTTLPQANVEAYLKPSLEVSICRLDFHICSFGLYQEEGKVPESPRPHCHNCDCDVRILQEKECHPLLEEEPFKQPFHTLTPEENAEESIP